MWENNQDCWPLTYQREILKFPVSKSYIDHPNVIQANFFFNLSYIELQNDDSLYNISKKKIIIRIKTEMIKEKKRKERERKGKERKGKTSNRTFFLILS